jgi:two-component system phosphate regulon sensor histidine kinase PhoR
LKQTQDPRAAVTARAARAARIIEFEARGEESPDFGSIFKQYIALDKRGVILVDHTRSILEINDAAREMLRFSGRIPCWISDVVGDVNVGFSVGDALHDRRTVVHESFIPEPEAILRFTVIPLNDHRGHTSHAVATIEDVTQVRHLETVRRDFVANVSHELRTPIASINLLVETLQNGAAHDPEAARHFLHRIQVETLSMNRLVEELLELSKLESGRLSLKIEATNVGRVIDDVRNRLVVAADEKHVHLLTDVQDNLPDVLADPNALEQVLMSLVHNAIKFTPEQGTISIRARRHSRSIDVFERFYKVDKGRNRGQGTGLGLAICRHLLELHGTKLQVVSSPGRGSRFSFPLPIVAA